MLMVVVTDVQVDHKSVIDGRVQIEYRQNEEEDVELDFRELRKDEITEEMRLLIIESKKKPFSAFSNI